MKNIVFLLSLLFLFVSCTKSNQEKAEDLIRKELNKVIVNIDTYEPIETKVDSAFAPMQSVETLDYITGLYDKMEKLYQLNIEVETAKEMMEINANNFYSSNRYNRYKEEFESKKHLLDSLTSEYEKQAKKISDYQNEEPVFNGYKAIQQYRYTNKNGEKTIGRGLFLFNKELDKVEYYIDLEDEKIKPIFELSEGGNASILKNQ